jgi:biopolymer transport protein ExbB/TolQ
MKSIIRIVIVAIIAILVYNYFFGTAEEKASSEKIFQEFVDLGKSVGDLVKNEKEKFDQGKYDQALEKIGGFIDNLKSKAEGSAEIMDQIEKLEKHKADIEAKLSTQARGTEVPDSYEQTKNQEEMDREINALLKETGEIVENINK